MEQIELKIPATLELVQLGAIAAANVATAYYKIITGNEPEEDNTFIGEVELAVGEACTNSARHCDKSSAEDYQISVCFELYDGKLVVIVSDQNSPFDFDKVLPPDFNKIPEHGYGLYLIKQIMDEVHYLRQDGKNILTLKKSIVTKE